MHWKKGFYKCSAALLSVGMLGLFGTAEYYSSRMPSTIMAESGGKIRLAEYPEITCGAVQDRISAASETFPTVQRSTFSLFGAIPLKNVQVFEAEAPVLVAGGEPFGIKLLMDGVMVTRLGEVMTAEGKCCPAADSGIEVGDVIRLADGQHISSNSQLQNIICSSGGREISLCVSREGREFNAYLKPVCSDVSKVWRGGMWVRDSIAGIGTMTFIDKSTGRFAGLGHPICDSDTGEIVPIQSGEAVSVDITEAKRGEKGIPGELHGQFTDGASLGILTGNNGCGVFGELTSEAAESLESGCEEYKIGYRQDAVTGSAEIISTVSGSKPEHYSIEIESVNYSDSESGRNMVIRITDERLLSLTGGIVQGMSGSPVIQNGKLIGAVTHVFVADPTKGYAIFAENMAEFLR